MYLVILIIVLAIILIGLYVLHNSENKMLILIFKVLGIMCTVMITIFLITIIYTAIKSLIAYGNLKQVENLFRNFH